ncbi:MAG: hypothetical protein ACPGGK_00065 [Pikeienuella sp.]
MTTPSDQMHPSEPCATKVRRRCVLYVYGFDPAPAERYRRLVQRAGGPGADVSEIQHFDEHTDGWTVDAGGVTTRFEVLGYEDIIREFQARSAVTRLSSGFRWWADFALSGTFRRVFRLTRGPTRLYLYPLVVFVALYAVCLGGLALVNSGLLFLGGPDISVWFRLIAAAPLMIWLSKSVERIFYPNMMLALFEFMFRMAKGAAPAEAVEHRIGEFAQRIKAVQTEGYDEVLVVGHSLGGLLALRALAKAIPDGDERKPLNFMTIGSIAGFVAFQGGSGAKSYCEDLITVASAKGVFWLDVSAPRDWFSFGLLDPLLTVDDPPSEAQSPRVISAKFGPWQREPDDWRTMFQPMGLHMKYLDAPKRSGAFDFFEVTCGVQTLHGRYKDRRNSPKARIRKP